MPMLRTPTATALAVRYLLRGCDNFSERVVGQAFQPAPSLGRLESLHYKAHVAPGGAGPLLKKLSRPLLSPCYFPARITPGGCSNLPSLAGTGRVGGKDGGESSRDFHGPELSEERPAAGMGDRPAY